MLKMIKIELHRAFKNKSLVISLIIGCIITISHVVQNVLPLTKYLAEAVSVGMLPHTVFNKWIGGEVSSIQPTIFFMLFPILACLPFSDTYFTDKNSGYLKNVMIRTKAINYYIAKYIATFLSGGTAIIIPLFMNLFLSAMCLPSIIPDSSTGFFSVFANCMWSDLYYSNPYLYVFFYLIVDFVFAGIFAVLSLVFSDFVTNRFFVLLSPFVMYIFVFSFSNLFQCQKYNPFVFLNPTQQVTGISFLFLFFTSLILLMVSFGIFVRKGVKSEVF